MKEYKEYKSEMYPRTEIYIFLFFRVFSFIL